MLEPIVARPEVRKPVKIRTTRVKIKVKIKLYKLREN